MVTSDSGRICPLETKEEEEEEYGQVRFMLTSLFEARAGERHASFSRCTRAAVREARVDGGRYTCRRSLRANGRAGRCADSTQATDGPRSNGRKKENVASQWSGCVVTGASHVMWLLWLRWRGGGGGWEGYDSLQLAL